MGDKIKPSVKTRIKRGVARSHLSTGELPVAAYAVDWEKGMVSCYLTHNLLTPEELPEGWGPFNPPEPYTPHPDWKGNIAEYAHFASLQFEATLPNPNITTEWWDRQEVKK